ncbi:NAD binding domain of 6-phosphogluconate dehydrogenase-domain-containing protein [Fusarium redolens]|uniref:3-hydroxyisobutyrate dehydrogenase n=1 Tax=Fusarium redolens TaxID=48865 RepID=A0A9P9HNF3_FUSRE|nr:NAD binding domain of 6-phosphogluconate dehydrogenase-domain-containing protein [Fusarium redolens]KAH7260735.1 NAD binding domain of 6-phosphogluconate dehydrogenase-domain-containing protein [Fusarium redolens]
MATTNGSSNGISAKSFGFIGLGIMGWGMAKNLRAKIPADSVLYVCEVNKPRRDEFVASTAGKIQVVDSPREIAEKSDIIITMLPRGEHVREVFTNPQTGLLSVAGSVKLGSKVFIDCSTIDVKTSQEVAAAVEASDLGSFADAPVSGGQGGANAGTLTFMVGGSPEAFETAKPTLELMGNPENLFHCGKAGAGLVTKLINNYLSAVNMIGVCEGMNMGRLYGLDPVLLASAINSSTGMSRNSREQNPVKGVSSVASSAKDFEGGFSTVLCHGVLQMAMKLSEQLGAKSLLAPVVRDMYDCAVENDKCRDKDFRSIYRLFSEDNGDQLPRRDLKN